MACRPLPCVALLLCSNAWLLFAHALPSSPSIESSTPIISTNVNFACRMKEKIETCSLPSSLGNFQGYHRCPTGVKIGRPQTYEQLQAIVMAYPHVKANGVGHSWWTEQFCSGNSSDSVNIVTTELEPTLSFVQKPVDPIAWLNSTIPDDFPIKVNEDNATVTVAAGITQRMLLDYLANYTHWKSPVGWTYPAYSWYIDQTVGGAVATGTHGSSLTWGSISSQVRGLKILLANGTTLELTAETNPHLWKAVGVSVGRLGIITEVTLRIVPDSDIQRTGRKLTFDAYFDEIFMVQEEYKAALKSNDTLRIKHVLSQLDESTAFWIVPNAVLYRLDFKHVDKTQDTANQIITLPQIEAMDGPNNVPGVFDQMPHPAVEPDAFTTDPNNVLLIAATSDAGVQAYTYNATLPRNKAFPSELETDVAYFARSSPYEQLEVSVPLAFAADCMRVVGQEMYNTSEELWRGFRTPALIRYVSGEEFYLSPTNGGPRMYVNMEDYLSNPTTQSTNPWFDKVIDIFVSKCPNVRFHLGKYMPPELRQCYDPAVAYPQTWCDFGCAVNELDPDGKFASEALEFWRWNATKDGDVVKDFGTACCTAEGFNKAACRCEANTMPTCQKNGFTFALKQQGP